MHGKSTDVDGRFCSHKDCLRMFPWVHKMWTEVDGTYCRRTESWRSWQKVPLTYGKLSELDGKSRCHTESEWKAPRKHGKLTEGPADALKLTEVYRRSCASMKCWQKVPWMQGMLMEDLVDPRKFDGSWRKVPRTQGKLTKVYRMSRGCTETFRASKGPSVNFPFVSKIFRRHKANFCAATGPSATSVRPRDIPSAFCVAAKPYVNFLELSTRTSTLRQIFFYLLDHP